MSRKSALHGQRCGVCAETGDRCIVRDQNEEIAQMRQMLAQAKK
ncbi:MAG TPA: hypothetical protein V6C71_24465 [Coleofasciculaceae cyanobacterium]|jgi:uncharacterized protein (DUF305 family)